MNNHFSNDADPMSVPNSEPVDHAPPAAAVTPKPVGAWSRVLIGSIAAFVLTVLLMVMAAFSQQSPKLARFFDEHGLAVLGIEVGVILGLTVVVLAIERRGQ